MEHRMEHSENYGFALPTAEDDTLADIGVISENFKTVDRVMKKNENLGVELNKFEGETMDAVGRLSAKDADLQSQINMLSGVDMSEFQSQLDNKSDATNLVNGSAEGSLRSISAKAEDSDYTMGVYAVALGYGATASGNYSYAEGFCSIASGDFSHAEGSSTTASGNFSHSEGFSTTASGIHSHAEGSSTTASSIHSHAEGFATTASGLISHAEGAHTIASGDYQHAQGKFNIKDTNNRYAHIVGNGEIGKNPSNAHTLDWDGNAWFAGDVLVGGTSQDDENAINLVNISTKNKTDIESLKAKDTDLQSQIDALSSVDVSELQSQLDTLQTNVNGLQMQVGPMYGDMNDWTGNDTVYQAVTKLKAKDTDLQSQIDNLGGVDVSELETDIETLKTNVSNLQSADATAMDSIGRLMTADENLQSQIDTLESDIVDLQAQTLQQTPLFAESIEECTDTSSLYVLPDGYIYAYTSSEQEVFTDVLSKIGYTDDMRLNSSGVPVEWTATDTDVTGYIPCQVGDIIRVKNMPLPYTYASGTYWSYVATYDADKTFIKMHRISQNGADMDVVVEDDDIVQFSLKSATVSADTAYIIIDAQDITDESEVYVNSEIKTVSEWANTGLAFVPADYEPRIIELEKETADHEARLKSLETNTDSSDVPSYWVEELEAKSDAIQSAMEKAGRNKSAFLWYTDAHWVNGNSKVSPKLLNYLYMNTPMNKVNFGGDIIGNSLLATREDMKYIYEWRKAIKDLPNHHSVLGNHDMFESDSVDYENDNYRYALMIAPEETTDMVMGDGNYYYIDNHAEKTRYLYLCYPNNVHADMVAQCNFIADAIKGVQEGWHIVVISHRWWQYSSSSTPTVGKISAYEQEILNIFDEYNARGTHTASNYFYEQDFSSCVGKVEFCIGGHIHVDYDFSTDGGIPIIITAPDVNQNRVPDSEVDSGTLGTITESAVFGIVADYNKNKITVVGVGRGTSREISY